MKKSKLALAVAGATTAPMLAQADAVLYGNMRPQLRQQNKASCTSPTNKCENRYQEADYEQ
ncbi:hypothetical protein [Marinobacterium stanieri]|uniref:hypothetical protein n=1 Tax=Marinobacterium stanieri TaxID=49186 RepID=UPI0002557839|nr:hypothetical protein [Marinobacterium stanieri]